MKTIRFQGFRVLRVAVFIGIVMMSGAATLQAAQVGIKYNRSKWEYPKAALADFKRFHEDRINTVMICLPWAEWEPSEEGLDETFILKGLAPVLAFCEKHKMTVIISNHCSYWDHQGDWSIPAWIAKQDGFNSSVSVLVNPLLRARQIYFLKRLIEATCRYPSVIGYNILNEPVAATQVYVKERHGEFEARWQGVIDIAEKVRRYMKKIMAPQFLIIGNGYSQPGFEKFNWENTGQTDLRPLWNNVLDPIAGQDIRTMIALSSSEYGARAKIQTESSLNFGLLNALRRCGNDFLKLNNPPNDRTDYSIVVYDYDGAYNFEGNANAEISHLKAFYVWRVGAPEGSTRKLDLFDHRRRDRATPYYYALRDLASGIDSFEAVDESQLPQNGSESSALDAERVKPGISNRWSGSGTIVGQNDNLLLDRPSTMAARMTLESGQSVLRLVQTAHWKDNGVSASDGLAFSANAEEGGEIVLTVKCGERTFRYPLKLTKGVWRRYRVPFAKLGIRRADVFSITQVGFANESFKKQVIAIDDFLIR